MPLGNDLLLIVLTARRHTMLFYYAAMATAGSVMGCLIMDLISRRGGEKGLKSTIGDKRTEYVKKKVKRYGGWALAVSALMPPPFPFTPFVAGAAAFQFPRKKLLSVIAVSRFVRFSIDGSLAVLFGTRILKWVQAPEVVYGIIFIVVVSIVASVISIYGWIQRSRSAAGRSRRSRQPAHAR
jgi:membrane protein DedA with SNARE-associated domain